MPSKKNSTFALTIPKSIFSMEFIGGIPDGIIQTLALCLVLGEPQEHGEEGGMACFFTLRAQGVQGALGRMYPFLACHQYLIPPSLPPTSHSANISSLHRLLF